MLSVSDCFSPTASLLLNKKCFGKQTVLMTHTAKHDSSKTAGIEHL